VLRILVADEHEVVRVGVETIIKSHAGWKVVAVAANGGDTLEKALETEPDVAIIDYTLPFGNGVHVTREIRTHLPNTEVLVFTAYDREDLVAEFVEAGARGHVLKSNPMQQLVAAVEALASHKPFFTPDVSEILLPELKTKSRAELSVLTPRERDVVRLIAEGHTSKALAEMLNLTISTIETHRASAKRKLNVSTSAALVRYAVRNKLIEP
jgi:DNA-binding NarL/FixJ family response regulator